METKAKRPDFSRFSAPVLSALAQAQRIAVRRADTKLRLEDLLVALIADSVVVRAYLESLAVDPEMAAANLAGRSAAFVPQRDWRSTLFPNTLVLGADAKQLLQRAWVNMQQSGHNELTENHLLLAMAQHANDSPYLDMWSKGMNEGAVRTYLASKPA